MKKSGSIAGSALRKSLETINIGVSEIEVDKAAEEEIYKLGGDLSYKTVPDYKYATCITVNDQVVHGLPTERKFKEGDLVSVDLAVMYKGWHTDCAWSVLVGTSEHREKQRFLKVGEEALWDGIYQAKLGNRIGDISYAIQSRVEKAGYHIVRSLVGHGIGRSLHEDPEVPGFGDKGTGVILKQGMTLAIEVIYTKNTSEVVLGSDNWTFSASDGSWGGLFEMTVIVGKEKAEVLTKI
ncbi:type I methionyl aminopeptidase [Candidatus Daviesbacteria bacterium]|nr:type I methionyl aminopeptidase [Candidatus Daviesbacteria bacterium]